MKSIQRFLGRFLIGLFVCFLVFFVANIAGLTVYLRVLYDTHEGDEDFSPTWAVRDTVEGLTKQDGEYQPHPSWKNCARTAPGPCSWTTTGM